jgi:hypothetical protein
VRPSFLFPVAFSASNLTIMTDSPHKIFMVSGINDPELLHDLKFKIETLGGRFVKVRIFKTFRHVIVFRSNMLTRAF